jgi:hypothetical protein
MYIVLETQTSIDGTVGSFITPYASRAEAESKYYTVLAYAALSSVYQHTAFLLTDDGYVIMSKSYRHEPPESEPEEEAVEPIE